MYVAQLILLLLFVTGFLTALKQDFHGRTAKEPYGFGGAVITIIISALMFWCHVAAGAFSAIFPKL